MWKQNGRKKEAVPSSNLTVCYWKLPFIVELPIENGDFSIAMLVYQRVMKSEHARETLSVRLFVWPLHETVIYLPNHLDVDNKSSDVIFSSRFTRRKKVVDIFQRISKEVAGDVPLKVINDGEVINREHGAIGEGFNKV